MTCSHHGCRGTATHWLIDPDGKRNPGGWICLKHGRMICDEYREKLNERWTLERLKIGYLYKV